MLDWRLGLDLAKIAANDKYIPDFMGKDGYWRPLLLKRLNAFAKQEIDAVLCEEKDETFLMSINEKKFILAHPFWSESKIKSICKKYNCSFDNVVFINKFIQNLKV